MWATRLLIALMVLSLPAIGSGCILQPVSKVEREFNVVDYDAPALRLARPVRAELVGKDPETGKWTVRLGWGIIPAGAYVKGRAPKHRTIEEVLKEEDDGESNSVGR